MAMRIDEARSESESASVDNSFTLQRRQLADTRNAISIESHCAGKSLAAIAVQDDGVDY